VAIGTVLSDLTWSPLVRSEIREAVQGRLSQRLAEERARVDVAVTGAALSGIARVDIRDEAKAPGPIRGLAMARRTGSRSMTPRQRESRPSCMVKGRAARRGEALGAVAGRAANGSKCFLRRRQAACDRSAIERAAVHVTVAGRAVVCTAMREALAELSVHLVAAGAVDARVSAVEGEACRVMQACRQLKVRFTERRGTIAVGAPRGRRPPPPAPPPHIRVSTTLPSRCPSTPGVLAESAPRSWH
jgi:hypothetical protein